MMLMLKVGYGKNGENNMILTQYCYILLQIDLVEITENV